MTRGPLVLLLAAIALLVGAGPVVAHESAPTGVIRVAQTLADRELTVTLTPPPTGSGRMGIALEALGAPSGRPVTVGVEGGGTRSGASIVPGAVGTPGRGAVDLDDAGDRAVVLEDGGMQARIPLRWEDPGTPGPTWATRIGAAVAVVAGIAASTFVRRRVDVAAGLGVLAAAGAAVAVTAVVLGPTPTPPGYVAGDAPAASSGAQEPEMAGMSGMAGTSGMAGSPGEGAVLLGGALRGPVLDLRLSDGSTGTPVDDLRLHDEAFIHLAVLGPDGSEQHLHPVRTGPGRWQVRPATLTPGRHGLFAEFSRDGVSHQQVRSAVDVPGPTPAPGTLPAPGRQSVAGLVVDVAAPDAVAGRPTTVRATFTRDGLPVTDLQPWLGMAGHVFVLGPGQAGGPDPADVTVSFAHVHDMQARPPGRGYGPVIAVDYTFPEPGTYRLWIQVLRGGSLVTVPVQVPVGGPAAGA